MNFIRNTVKIENIENTVRCYVTDNPLTLGFIQESISNQDLRRQWIQSGCDDAIKFLDSLGGSVL